MARNAPAGTTNEVSSFTGMRGRLCCAWECRYALFPAPPRPPEAATGTTPRKRRRQPTKGCTGEVSGKLRGLRQKWLRRIVREAPPSPARVPSWKAELKVSETRAEDAMANLKSLSWRVLYDLFRGLEPECSAVIRRIWNRIRKMSPSCKFAWELTVDYEVSWTPVWSNNYVGCQIW